MLPPKMHTNKVHYRWKKNVGVALCQKPLRLARCRNVGMLTGQGWLLKTTYTHPIPTSFFMPHSLNLSRHSWQLLSARTPRSSSVLLHALIPQPTCIMTKYRIAPNFRGAKFSRIGFHKHFADQGFQLARPQAFRKAWGRSSKTSKLATPLDWIVSTARVKIARNIKWRQSRHLALKRWCVGTTCTKTSGMQLLGNSCLANESLGTVQSHRLVCWRDGGRRHFLRQRTPKIRQLRVRVKLKVAVESHLEPNVVWKLASCEFCN